MFQGSSKTCNYTQGFASGASEMGDGPTQQFKKTASRFDSGSTQAEHCCFRGDWRIVNLFEGVGASLRRNNGQYFDMPVVVIVDGLPVPKALGAVQAVGRSVKDEVELLCNSANALQGTAQERAKVPHATRP